MIDYPESLCLNLPQIFDSHAHYDDSKFDGIREELLDKLFTSGVSGIVTCSVDGESANNSLSLAEKYENLYAAVGIHPENLNSNTSIEEIEALSKHPKCVAIGEIGLDYYWESDNKEQQIKTFEEQLILANKLGLPVIVHDRDAHADTLELLKKHKPKGVVHCFSGSVEMAEEILKLGMYIGVGGVVTFKNAKKLPDVVKIIPDDKLLVETDCPYLAPEPFRGKLCHSGHIIMTAEKIAETKNTTRDYILKMTLNNAKELFNL